MPLDAICQGCLLAWKPCARANDRCLVFASECFQVTTDLPARIFSCSTQHRREAVQKVLLGCFLDSMRDIPFSHLSNKLHDQMRNVASGQPVASVDRSLVHVIIL